jgi:hypothetical protein
MDFQEDTGVFGYTSSTAGSPVVEDRDTCSQRVREPMLSSPVLVGGDDFP